MALPELAFWGKPIVMPPDEQVSDWMHAADAAEVFTRAYRAQNLKHRIFNMSGKCRKTGEITAFLRQMLPQAQISVSDQPFTMTSLVKTDRLRTELGFTPKYTVEEGILAYLSTKEEGNTSRATLREGCFPPFHPWASFRASFRLTAPV